MISPLASVGKFEKTEENVSRIGPLPIGPDERSSPELVVAFDPLSDLTGRLYSLRNALMLRMSSDCADTRLALAVVSADRGDGRSFMAANLAIAFAQMGERTLLIDADLRHPRQHHLFRLANRQGLAAYLTGRASAAELVVPISTLPNMTVLAAGTKANPVHANPQDLLCRAEFSDMIQAFKGLYDVVLIDTPAGSLYTDAQIIANRAGAALAVARRNVTGTARLMELIVALRNTGSVMAGSVYVEH